MIKRASLLVASLLLPAIAAAQPLTIFDNDRLRFGNGSEDSIVDGTGSLKQPFYFSTAADPDRYFPLTYADGCCFYPIDVAIAVGGDGSNTWNVNGDRFNVAQNGPLTGFSIDDSGYVSTNGGTKGYGVLIASGTATLGTAPNEATLLLEHRYELGETASFIKITTSLTNTTSETLTNVRVWVGTRDDWVGTTDSPTKTRGNIVDGAFVALTDAATRADAIQVTSGAEGVLFYTPDNTGYASQNSCCNFDNTINQNPATAAITATNDGSYGMYFRLPDLAAGATETAVWYYAGGATAEFSDIIADVASAAAALDEISFTTGVFSATLTANGTGYWIVVPAGSDAPTEEQISAGVDYGDVEIVASGSASMLADTPTDFNISGLDQNTDYDLYFVAQSGDPATFTDVTSASFTTLDDDDGVSANEEASAPNGGDGNDDGTPDSQQNDVASISTTEGGYATIVSVSGLSLSSVTENPTLPAPLPDGAITPYGAFGFVANGVTTGATESFQLFLPYDRSITGALKWNSDTNAWDTIGTVSNVGTTFTVITFSIIEGGPYDSDASATTITDPIVPLGARAPAAPVPTLPVWAAILMMLGLVVAARARLSTH
jgi:hypothetical protein